MFDVKNFPNDELNTVNFGKIRSSPLDYYHITKFLCIYYFPTHSLIFIDSK